MIEPIAVVLLGAAILPTFALLYGFTKNRSKNIGIRRHELSPKNYGRVLEAMNGYVDVKLSNIENELLDRYADTQRKMNDVDALFFGIYHKLNQRTNDLIFGLGILVIFGWAHFTNTGTKEVLSLLGLFAIAAYKFLPSVNRIMSALMTLKNSSFVIGELRQAHDAELVEFEKVSPLKFEKELSLQQISYTYPKGEGPVLRGIDILIPKGNTIGFIGSSGSGKTTLLKVILRLLDITDGAIVVDDTIITQDNTSSFQKIIGYVEQEIFILNDTIRANVAFARDDYSDSKVWQSLREAQLEDFVKKHPDGLDMKLGENGVNLSGGQKQRIGIARAMYKDSEILVFDEATSALDTETERAVVESIKYLSDLGKTVIIVAHRLTTLERCDKIYELSEGKVIAEHDYTKLINEKILQGR